MPSVQDGPRSAQFAPLNLRGTMPLADVANAGVSPAMAAALAHAPSGSCVSWGIPFSVEQVVVVKQQPVTVELAPTTGTAITGTPIKAQWLIFMHTSDLRPAAPGAHGFMTPMRGEGRLGELAATYVLVYADGTEARAAIRRRHQIGMFQRRWGENCFEAVAHAKPHPTAPAHEQPGDWWGSSQTRVNGADFATWINWLWAWENPWPDKPLVALRCEPGEGMVVLSGLAAGTAAAHPLRWQTRRKACLTLPAGTSYVPDLNENGRLAQIQLDMGQVIAATPRLLYPGEEWAESYDNQMPQVTRQEVLIEYTAHPDGCFHLGDENTIPVALVESARVRVPLQTVAAATQRVTLRTVEQGSGRPVAVRLHVHGAAGEYLAPVGRHRQPNPSWFEDYGAEFVHVEPSGLAFGGGNPYKVGGILHPCTYVGGEMSIDLPLGPVYVEVSRGFETRPLRQVFMVTAETRELVVEFEKVLPWRERGWVTADTHVHFLSPTTALLEGAAEGVNVVNLLASQWGELMTNVGDFDGRTTWGSPGSRWRRRVPGAGRHRKPPARARPHLAAGLRRADHRAADDRRAGRVGPGRPGRGPADRVGPAVPAAGRTGGAAPFPQPARRTRRQHRQRRVDAVEMTSWGDLYAGIDPYSLSDWYRYLNCGYRVAAVGGTDKMTATTAVGTVRTYARISATTRSSPTRPGWRPSAAARPS